MTLAGFALRNAFLRNKTRSGLTILGTVVAALAFVFLRTVLSAWYANSEASAQDRIVARNAISITQPLPLAYRERIAQVPGVSKVTWSNWFGGIYKERRNFFAQFAIDPVTGLDVFNLRFTAGNKEDFVSDRNSCIVGKSLAERYGFKVGDTVPSPYPAAQETARCRPRHPSPVRPVKRTGWETRLGPGETRSRKTRGLRGTRPDRR